MKGSRLYAASLVTTNATARAMLTGKPDQITLVAMGDNGVNRTDEDELCAIHLRNRLEDRPGDASHSAAYSGRWRSWAFSRSGPAPFAPGGCGHRARQIATRNVSSAVTPFIPLLRRYLRRQNCLSLSGPCFDMKGSNIRLETVSTYESR